MIWHQGRQVTRLDAEPSPLHFVSGGEPRIEIVRGEAGQMLSSNNSNLAFSSDFLTWHNNLAIPPNGTLFVRYTPSAGVIDAVFYPVLNVGGVLHHCEALELQSVPNETQHSRELVRAIPRAYREDSHAMTAVAKTLAWLTYPTRCLLARHDALHNPQLTPSHHLEVLRNLVGLPELRGLPVTIRREICENANLYYSNSGLVQQLEQLIAIFTGITPTITGAGVHQLNVRLSGLPVEQATFIRQVQFWMPAWVIWTAFFGYYYDGEIFHDGQHFHDGTGV